MIIDFHTHTYPSNIASRIMSQLSGPSHVKAYTDGTNQGLIDSCKKNNISKSIVLPVVTKVEHTEITNKTAIETNRVNNYLISFGGIHPNCSNYKDIISTLSKEGIPGIKLHPIFQKINIDDIRYLRIIDCACEHDLIVSIHAGYDINDLNALYSTVPHLRNMLNTLHPNKMILAHMGGHLCWNEAEEMLAEYLSNTTGKESLYVDTAFSLPSPISSENIPYDFLSNEQFLRIVRLIGPEHVLFGTDSPWTNQGPSIEAIVNSGLSKKEISLILYENAKNLLNITD